MQQYPEVVIQVLDGNGSINTFFLLILESHHIITYPMYGQKRVLLFLIKGLPELRQAG